MKWAHSNVFLWALLRCLRLFFHPLLCFGHNDRRPSPSDQLSHSETSTMVWPIEPLAVQHPSLCHGRCCNMQEGCCHISRKFWQWLIWAGEQVLTRAEKTQNCLKIQLESQERRGPSSVCFLVGVRMSSRSRWSGREGLQLRSDWQFLQAPFRRLCSPQLQPQTPRNHGRGSRSKGRECLFLRGWPPFADG